MPKYRKKPEFVEAEVYQPGMEDMLLPTGQDRSWPYIYSCPNYKAPVIPVMEGHYILTHADGTRSVMSPEEFERQYERVEE
mgnify:CR=1 FL=1